MSDYPITEPSVQDEVVTSQDAFNKAAEALSSVFTDNCLDKEYLPDDEIIAEASSNLHKPGDVLSHINTSVMVNEREQKLTCWTDSDTIGDGLTAIIACLIGKDAHFRIRIVYDANMIAIRAETSTWDEEGEFYQDYLPAALVYTGIAFELMRQGIYLGEDEIIAERK